MWSIELQLVLDTATMSINIHVSCVYMPLQSYGLVQLLKFAKRRQGNDIVERKKKKISSQSHTTVLSGDPLTSYPDQRSPAGHRQLTR